SLVQEFTTISRDFSPYIGSIRDQSIPNESSEMHGAWVSKPSSGVPVLRLTGR
ncbi:hypothetical protein EMPG_10777, partial [Blastomyces silverae]